MILRILYRMMPGCVHRLMYDVWGKVIVQHTCRDCGQEWYSIGDPVFRIVDHVMTRNKSGVMLLRASGSEKDVMGDVLNLGEQSDANIQRMKDEAVQYSHHSPMVWPTGNERNEL